MTFDWHSFLSFFQMWFTLSWANVCSAFTLNSIGMVMCCCCCAFFFVAEKERCYTFNDILHRIHDTSKAVYTRLNKFAYAGWLAGWLAFSLAIVVIFPIHSFANAMRQKWINNSIGIN